MKSIVYWHPFTYNLIMRLLYGSNFEERYKSIANIIPNNASVVEVCAGDGYLYRHYLKNKNVTYVGYDINPALVRASQKKGISMLLCNLFEDQVPMADYVLIQASLYQFIPRENEIITKLLNSARIALIVAEPVKNLSDSSNPIIRFLARRSANPGSGHVAKRFNSDTLRFCFTKYPEFRDWIEVKGGREAIGVFRK